MDLKDIMKYNNFVVIGNTLDTEKYAYKIKHQLLEQQYRVECVGKELTSINDVEMEIDVLDLCIHPVKGLTLLKECRKPFKAIIIQPGAESAEIIEYLEQNNIFYLEACVLVGLRLYAKNKMK